MAQSKKELLKRVGRHCSQAGQAIAYTAYAAGDVKLLDAYGQLRRDIRETLEQLRRPSASLRESAQPVTFQHVDRLHSRLMALQSRIIHPPPPHDHFLS